LLLLLFFLLAAAGAGAAGAKGTVFAGAVFVGAVFAGAGAGGFAFVAVKLFICLVKLVFDKLLIFIFYKRLFNIIKDYLFIILFII
jgi:hypothetical protein